jgi:hypothetical protein
MLPRALAPTVLCASALWPLGALACFNSMDSSAFVFNPPLGLDLFLWTAGAVFLNQVVLVNVWVPTAEGQPRPSWFRRSFFLLVGVCLLLLLATISAGGPLLSLSAQHVAKCSLNHSMMVMLAAGPAVAFTLQAVLFQGWRKRLFGNKRAVALVSLVVTSVLLVLGVSRARDVMVLPHLCRPWSPAVYDVDGKY